MANTTTEKPKSAAQTAAPPLTSMAVIAPVVGWFIPGAGHFLLKRYIRGLLLMTSVLAMFLLGLAMQGRVYQPNGGDILDILGFVGDVGAGALYILARINDWGGVAISHATADYGTKYLIVSGLLNFIAAADAHHIALGKKP
jgi:TM2 domain-containing membrane protein YozV